MFIYIFVYTLLWYFSLITSTKRKEKSLGIYAFFIFLFWLFSWLRWDMGTDWETYCPYFEQNYSYDDFMYANNTMEGGYRFLNYAVKQILDSYTFLLFIIGSFIFAIQYNFFAKYSPLPLVFLLACFALSRGNIFFTRQTIACTICLLALIFLLKGKRAVFFALVVFASTFHSSSIIFLFIYLLDRYTNWSLKKLNVITIASSAVAFFAGAYFMKELSGYMSPIIEYKINRYMEAGDDMQTGQSLLTLLINGIINRGFFFILFAYAAKKFYNDNNFKIFYKMYCLLMAVFFMTVSINVSLTRLAFFFESSQYILLAYFIKTCKKDNIMMWMSILYGYLLVRFYMGTLNGVYKDAFIPIKTIFD